MLNLKNLDKVFQNANSFIKTIESNSFSLNSLYSNIHLFYLKLENLTSEGNIYSEKFSECFSRKFFSFVDNGFVLVCFLLTPKGLKYFRDLDKDCQFVHILYTTTRKSFRVLCTTFNLDFIVGDVLFNLYLTSSLEIISENPYTYWENFSKMVLISNNSFTGDAISDVKRKELIGQNICTDILVEVAKRSLEFATAEASAERVFCYVRNLIGDFRGNMGSELIEALVRIKMQEADEGF